MIAKLLYWLGMALLIASVIWTIQASYLFITTKAATEREIITLVSLGMCSIAALFISIGILIGAIATRVIYPETAE
jgi:hypothetical protein